MKRRSIARLIGYSLLAVVAYFLSYAPFLLVVKSSGLDKLEEVFYRSPPAYRAVEWCIAYPPAQQAFFKWSELLGVEDATRHQMWYFGMGIEDPSTEIEFHSISFD